jgi:hypothetical protein
LQALRDIREHKDDQLLAVRWAAGEAPGGTSAQAQ